MSLPVDIENRQRLYADRRPAVKKLTLALAQKAAVPLRDITLILVDDEQCAPINEAAVGHQGPTDVITITYPSLPGEEAGDSAEIILNVECAWNQGGGAEGADRELAFYLAHAFDHLAGHDDNTPAARTSMHRREWRWIRSIGEIGELFRKRA